jgi:mRNA-degrading endonuclease toxin of MazEF toxin-antitoxin module
VRAFRASLLENAGAPGGEPRGGTAWVHVVHVTSRPGRPLPSIIELGTSAAPLTGRLMADELELAHKDDLEGGRGMLSRSTMRALDQALRQMLAL